MRAQAKVIKTGNSWALRLPKTSLELAGLKPDQTLDVEVRPGRLILRRPGKPTVAEHKLDQAYKDVKAVWQQALDDVWFEVFGPEE